MDRLLAYFLPQILKLVLILALVKLEDVVVFRIVGERYVLLYLFGVLS